MSRQITSTTDAISRQMAVQSSLASLMKLAQHIRDENRHASQMEQRVFEMGYRWLDSGYNLPHAWCTLGTSGFRPIQTWLSLADPGPGHIGVTTRCNCLLHGTIVHLEHIDRHEEADKEKLEPYRIPATRHVARVRLHVGIRSPTTVFIGRPVFENHIAKPPDSAAPLDPTTFRTDFLKTVRVYASACSCMFRYGIADCKIAIERLTYSQAILFMKKVAENVIRDPKRQSLSAAFNINTTLHYDHGDKSESIDDPKAIGMIGVIITKLGGFDRIAWDGASSEIPSRPITDRLSFVDLVDLVHEAHQSGLETYISAGMHAEHMCVASYAGVDAVGIGTSLHYPGAKMLGQLNPEAIREALCIRDAASLERPGCAARLLARLDILASRDALMGDEDALRQELYQAVRSQDMRAAGYLEEKLTRVQAMGDKCEHL